MQRAADTDNAKLRVVEATQKKNICTSTCAVPAMPCSPRAQAARIQMSYSKLNPLVAAWNKATKGICMTCLHESTSRLAPSNKAVPSDILRRSEVGTLFAQLLALCN